MPVQGSTKLQRAEAELPGIGKAVKTTSHNENNRQNFNHLPQWYKHVAKLETVLIPFPTFHFSNSIALVKVQLDQHKQIWISSHCRGNPKRKAPKVSWTWRPEKGQGGKTRNRKLLSTESAWRSVFKVLFSLSKVACIRAPYPTKEASK